MFPQKERKMVPKLIYTDFLIILKSGIDHTKAIIVQILLKETFIPGTCNSVACAKAKM